MNSQLWGKRTTIIGNISLIGLWLWLFRGVYPYLGIIFTRQEFRTNQIVLIGAILLIYLQVRKGELHPRLDKPPQLYRPAIGLILMSSLSYLLVERFLDVNTFSASLFGLAGYGLLGLWMRPDYWRQGFPAILLLIGALPFGEHLQTFVGYPLRLLTAAIVRDGLAAFGVQSIGVDTILVFESGISKVDLPCSGIKSIWTGGLFMLAVTWIDRRKIDLRWLVCGLAFIFSLLIANLARVAVLVTVGQVAAMPLVAELVHVPLGVLGFVAACLALVYLFRWAGANAPGMVDEPTTNLNPNNRPAWLTPVLMVTIIFLSLFYSPRPDNALAAPPTPWEFSSGITIETWALTAGEQKWLSDAGIESAERWRFQKGSLSGSILVISSNTWRAHHRPESCFQVYGLDVHQSNSQLVAPDFPVRVLQLGAGDRSDGVSAVYWLQSKEKITEDYATRIWSDLAPQRQKWILVTILFDRHIDPLSDEALSFYIDLRSAIQLKL